MKAYVLLTAMWRTVFRPLPRRNNDRSSARPLWCLSNTDAQDGIPLTETFLPELFRIMVITLQQ